MKKWCIIPLYMAMLLILSGCWFLEGRTENPTAPGGSPQSGLKLQGHIYLATTPNGADDLFNRGLYSITASDGKWQQISPRSIDGIALSPDGSKLAAGMLQETGKGSGDPQLAIYDVKNGYKPLKTVFSLEPKGKQKGPQQLTGPAWLNDNNTLVVSKVGDLYLYDLTKEQGSQKIWPGWFASVSSIENRVVVATSDGWDVLFDARKGGYKNDPWTTEINLVQTPDSIKIAKFSKQTLRPQKTKWSPEGDKILFVDMGKSSIIETDLLGDRPTYINASNRKVPLNEIKAAAYSPDGNYVVYAVGEEVGYDGGIWIAQRAGNADSVKLIKANLKNVWKIDLAWGQ